MESYYLFENKKLSTRIFEFACQNSFGTEPNTPDSESHTAKKTWQGKPLHDIAKMGCMEFQSAAYMG